MIINEYRLNLVDPKSGDFLNEQALAFFKIGDSGPPAEVDYVPPAS
jgi:Fe-S cluster biosynthesis and repair protein YggX